MKRHPALIPFSHDHHDGLVIAQRLLQGGSKAPKSQWPSDLEGQRDRVLQFGQDHLSHHLGAEEAILFPLARRFLGEKGARLVKELLGEHEALKQDLRTFQRGPLPVFQRRMQEWARLLRSHIRKEERILFQALQEQVPEKDLTAVSRQLEDYNRRNGRPEASCLL